MKLNSLIIYCRCSNANIIPPSVKDDVLRFLSDSGVAFEAVSDICAVSAKNPEFLKQLTSHDRVVVVACYPRAVKWLFSNAGCEIKNQNFEVLNMRVESSDKIQDDIKSRTDDSDELRARPPVGNKVKILLKAGVNKTAHSEEKYLLLKTLLDDGFNLSVSDENTNELCGIYTDDKFNEPASGGIELENINTEEIIKKIEYPLRGEVPSVNNRWSAWYPVIDFELCTHCMQCLSFCLFGVYGADENGKLIVSNPDKCKTNCPACSRVCPEMAIIFPKYTNAPMNGAEIDTAIKREKVDISVLLGGDIYEILRRRSREASKRFSSERNAELALEERRKCLAELASIIPPEVLAALPKPEEIQRRAIEASEKARQALKKQTEH